VGTGLSIVQLDNKGRITLPKQIRESLEIDKKVLIINAGDHIKMIPLPANPIKALHGAFNTKKSFKELRKQAEQIAQKETKEP